MLWTGPSLREDGKGTITQSLGQPYLQLEEAGEGEEKVFQKQEGAKKRKNAASKIQAIPRCYHFVWDKTLGITDPKTDVNYLLGFPPINPDEELTPNLLSSSK